MNITGIPGTASLHGPRISGIVASMKRPPKRHSTATGAAQSSPVPPQLTLREEIKLAEARAREETARLLARLRMGR